MSSQAEVRLPNMRGSAVTVGNRTHLLLMPNWRPRWSDHMRPTAEAPTLGSGQSGFEAFKENVRTGR
jgi:hypothetical protein